MLNADALPVEDERVRLRPLHDLDAEAYADGTADPQVRRYGHLPEPDYTPASVKSMIEREAAPGLARGDLAVLAIADATTDAFAGSLVLFGVTDTAAEVGFWIHPDHRGGGVAATAVALAARFARTSGLHKLTARTVPDNPASQRTLTAAGFGFQHTSVDATPSGERLELLHYSLSLTG